MAACASCAFLPPGAPFRRSHPSRREKSRTRNPSFLPDGNRFLFRVNGTSETEGIYVGSLDSGERIRLIAGDASLPAYGNGLLLFVRETTLMAQALDVERLELSGEATPLGPSVRTGRSPSSGGSFSISETGVLVWQEDIAETSQLVWLDRTGRETAVVSDRAEFGYLQMAPRDDRVAVSVTGPNGDRDLWLYDTTRGSPTRFTSDSADEFSAAWSPDRPDPGVWLCPGSCRGPRSGFFGAGAVRKADHRSRQGCVARPDCRTRNSDKLVRGRPISPLSNGSAGRPLGSPARRRPQADSIHRQHPFQRGVWTVFTRWSVDCLQLE